MHPCGVVHVDQQPVVDVHQQDAVLIVVGQAGHANAVRQLMPSAVFQHRDVEPGRAEALVDASAHMVRQQDLLVEVVRLRVRVQVVGMAVRDPHVLAVLHRLGLLRRDLVRQTPAPEVGTADDPRGPVAKTGAPVVANQRRVADRVETNVQRVPPSLALETRRETRGRAPQ